MSITDRVDQLDLSLFDEVPTGGTSSPDRCSLLAVHAALATRGPFSYLEVGSYLGSSLQALIADSRCESIVSIDRRDSISPDERSEAPGYPDNTTAHMIDCIRRVPGADIAKLRTIDASTADLDPTRLSANFCFIDAEHTNSAALRDARFCRAVIRDHGVIAFHDRTLVSDGISRFLKELKHYRAYPLASELLVVEINVPTLLSDPRVKAQVPRAAWLLLARVGALRLALRLASAARRSRRFFSRMALATGAPRRKTRRGRHRDAPSWPAFEIHTFVTDESLYQDMRDSFVGAGFAPRAFVKLTDLNDNPYAAIARFAHSSSARYTVLCHQDVRTDRGVGADHLLALLSRLDERDSRWVVAGTAGVTRSGLLIRRVVDRYAGSTGDNLPRLVVTLDENFLVFNNRNIPRSSPGLSAFHLYGADVCLNALSAGGSAYVIDFPVTHLGRGERDAAYDRAKHAFLQAWNDRCWSSYVVTPSDTLFLSRSRTLRRLFGGSAVYAIDQLRRAG